MTLVRGMLLRGFGPTGSATPPNAPTLAVADNGDGTGAVATITGSTAGATNTVSVQAVTGLGTSTWTTGGSRVGNGTVALSLAVGFYWVRVVSELDGATAVSNLVYLYVSATTTAIHYEILEAVQAKIVGLALSGISSANVQIRKIAWDKDFPKPGVLISPMPEEINPGAGTNERDDIGYRVAVVVMRVSNQNVKQAEMNQFLLWRQRIDSALLNQRLSGTAAWRVITEPGGLYIPEAFKQQHDVSALIFRVFVRRDRNI